MWVAFKLIGTLSLFFELKAERSITSQITAIIAHLGVFYRRKSPKLGVYGGIFRPLHLLGRSHLRRFIYLCICLSTPMLSWGSEDPCASMVISDPAGSTLMLSWGSVYPCASTYTSTRETAGKARLRMASLGVAIRLRMALKAP